MFTVRIQFVHGTVREFKDLNSKKVITLLRNVFTIGEIRNIMIEDKQPALPEVKK